MISLLLKIADIDLVPLSNDFEYDLDKVSVRQKGNRNLCFNRFPHGLLLSEALYTSLLVGNNGWFEWRHRVV